MQRLVLGVLTVGLCACGSSGKDMTGMAGGAGDAGGGAGGPAGTAGNGGGGAEDLTLTQGALSGTRLKAYFYSAPDGSKQFAQRWYDSMLKTDCYFQQGPDGTVRCLPQVSFGTILYSDAACSTPAAVAILKNACMPNPSPWVALSVADPLACNKFSTRYYNLGPAYTAQAFIASPGSAQPCVANGGDGGSAIYPPTSYDLFGLGTVLDLGMFQNATLAHD